MNIGDIITPSQIRPALKASSKKQTLQELAKFSAQWAHHDERAIFDILLERERLGTTGVGHGVAIPHGKLAPLDRLYGFFARLETPVPFDAIDEQPVDLTEVLEWAEKLLETRILIGQQRQSKE